MCIVDNFYSIFSSGVVITIYALNTMENISGAKDNHEDDKDVMAHDNEALIQENEKVETQTVTRRYWGWVVVLASFLNIGIIDGVGYTAGILLDSLLEELGG